MNENKLPKSFEPFADKHEATALMYYVIGHFSVDSNLSGRGEKFLQGRAI